MIEIGKIYNYFDDGKIRESRKYTVLITKIVPFAEAEEELKDYWRSEKKDCSWVYKFNTDYFIFGMLNLKEPEEIIFVRAKRFDWFSMGWWGGVLDVNNKLTESL